MGFFSSSELTKKAPAPTAPRCGACGLRKGCQTPQFPVYGRGDRGILIISECPSAQDDDAGELSRSNSSTLLKKALSGLDINLKRDCWLTHAVACRPKKGRVQPKHIAACRPNLLERIRDLQPRVVILLGGSPVISLIDHLWRKPSEGLMRWHGYQIPSIELNAWVCPTFHPSYVLQQKYEMLDRLFAKHLVEAVAWETPPYPEEVPDYEGMSRVIMEPARAANIIRGVIDKGWRVAFDYETNMLKPDSPQAEIVSCGVAWKGRMSIAFPWHGEAITAMSELLRSPCKKIGANIKFEQRWTRAILGHGVRNWAWDCMQAAHVLDNRQGVTSVKFQAFARLGQPYWADAVDPYFEAPTSNTPNRIRQLDLTSLLKYNAIDAMVEYHIAEAQRNAS